MAAENVDSETIIARVRTANVVGMGGGGFPASDKLMIAKHRHVDTVIGNAMATEPASRGDDHLLRTAPQRILDGLAYACRAVGAQDSFIATPNADLETAKIRYVDAPFPAGEETRLTDAATGRTVPTGARPIDVGVVVFNVGTLAAIADAVEGRATRGRFLGVDGTTRFVDFGTPLADLGLEPPLRSGGFSGRPATPSEPLLATTIAIERTVPSTPCIRCGWCVAPCPVALRPDALHEAFGQGQAPVSVDRCIECGACNAACPSHLDLVNEFRAMKAIRRQQRDRDDETARIKTRVTARETRLARHSEAAIAARRDRRGRRTWRPPSRDLGGRSNDDEPSNPDDG